MGIRIRIKASVSIQIRIQAYIGSGHLINAWIRIRRVVNTHKCLINALIRSPVHNGSCAEQSPVNERWGAGVETQKCTGRDWGMGSSTIYWNLRPVVKYHLRRGVGFMKFLENGSRPQPPTSPVNSAEFAETYERRYLRVFHSLPRRIDELDRLGMYRNE